ncbi:MAG: type II toxin-antitoxin system VapC family toxin [Aphanizomenon gracile PMC649.10]|jgi:ribonuclease VapC|nr:type II toxin-antitoxin system VapC family toxin [Aphanizomenon gracile PMC638.10]MDM3852443.1 type II toxin-antitoxin system VapC family toxin [Aphanizomenon gracile PMC627.10]MDM3857064.1 type II toxin-antitoxin system VapC family toxin [Aphanizomenon gracile PMC649.10]MDM3858652.1 type II toxin-antitoxin system VapC family toxin [Aphanizomenon gracile PMC644.10]
MVIDTSAIMAIIYAEPEELIFIELINESAECLLSSPGYVEASIVLGTKHGQQGVENLSLLIAALSITIVPFTVEQAQLATAAFLKFGKAISRCPGFKDVQDVIG